VSIFLASIPISKLQNCGNQDCRQLRFTHAAVGVDKRTTYLFVFWSWVFVGFCLIFSIFPQKSTYIGPDPWQNKNIIKKKLKLHTPNFDKLTSFSIVNILSGCSRLVRLTFKFLDLLTHMATYVRISNKSQR